MQPGTLYVVATPIGNIGDITIRALEILKTTDLIAAEDTRHTRKLTSHYNIKTPLTSYFEHNKIRKAEYLIRLLKEGRQIALVSNSGTPGISDPGFYIIRLAIRNDIPVTVIPGPCALIGGLVLSGLPTDKFVFEGFLSHKSAARRKRLGELSSERRTIILYESPHRLLKALRDILELLGDREVACIREITKMFEEARRGRVSQLIEHFDQSKPRGEFILVISWG